MRRRYFALAGCVLLAGIAFVVLLPEAAAQMSRVTTEVGKAKEETKKIYDSIKDIAVIVLCLAGIASGYAWYESKGSDKATVKAWATGVFISLAATPFLVDCAKGCAPAVGP